MSELQDIFKEAEELAEIHNDDLRQYALDLLRNSSLRGDDDGLEEEIIWGDIGPLRWREIFERLRYNQLRVIDKPNWGKTEFNKSYKEHGIDN